MAYALINGSAINSDDASAAPSSIIRPATLGVVTNIGTPTLIGADIMLRVGSVIRTARFGIPTVVSRVVQPGNVFLGVASLGAITQVGEAKVLTARQVVAGSIAPTFTAGFPTATSQGRAAGFRATVFGVPNAELIVHPAGVRTTSFGAPRVLRLVQVPSLPGLRYGPPRISGFTSGSAQGIHSTEFGIHSIRPKIHALPAAPGMRFGRPTIVRNSQC